MLQSHEPKSCVFLDVCVQYCIHVVLVVLIIAVAAAQYTVSLHACTVFCQDCYFEELSKMSMDYDRRLNQALDRMLFLSRTPRRQRDYMWIQQIRTADLTWRGVMRWRQDRVFRCQDRLRDVSNKLCQEFRHLVDTMVWCEEARFAIEESAKRARPVRVSGRRCRIRLGAKENTGAGTPLELTSVSASTSPTLLGGRPASAP